VGLDTANICCAMPQAGVDTAAEGTPEL